MEKIVSAHPDDMLVVGWLKEAVNHPQFKESQVFSSNSVQAFYGRSPRRIYYTPGFWETPRALECYEVLRSLVSRRQNCEFKPVDRFWQDQINDLAQVVALEYA